MNIYNIRTISAVEVYLKSSLYYLFLILYCSEVLQLSMRPPLWQKGMPIFQILLETDDLWISA